MEERSCKKENHVAKKIEEIYKARISKDKYLPIFHTNLRFTRMNSLENRNIGIDRCAGMRSRS